MFGVRCSVFGWCCVMFGVRVRCCVLFVVWVAGCPGFPAGELAGGLDAQKVVPTAGPGVLNVCSGSVPERVFVLCLCSCLGVGCSGVRVRVRLNTCCVRNPARAEHVFVFGQRCSGASLLYTLLGVSDSLLCIETVNTGQSLANRWLING